MSAQIEYTFDSIAPGVTTSVFIHGYSPVEAVTYCILPRDLTWFPDLPRSPNAVASYSIGDTSIHVDNTIARKVFVTNNSVPGAGSGVIGLDVVAIIDTIPSF